MTDDTDLPGAPDEHVTPRVHVIQDLTRALALQVDAFQATRTATPAEVASAVCTLARYILEAVIDDSPAAQVVQNRQAVLKGLGEIWKVCAMTRPEVQDRGVN